MWSYIDAIMLALDEARHNPEANIDTDALATEIWAEMQRENAGE